jgi:glucans biosynthesis protein C
MIDRVEVDRERMIFVDALRVVVIVMVVAHHAAQPYGPTGGAWPVSDAANIEALGSFFLVNAAFGMGLLFFLAGYFVPGSYDRKGASLFLRDRWVRIGLPLSFFALFVHVPAMYLLDPSTRSVGGFIRSSYQSGWQPMYIHLWFLGHLLLYSVGYVAWRRVTKGNSDGPRQTSPIPTSAGIAAFVAALGVVTWVVRWWYPIDEWVPLLFILAAEPAHLPQYVSLFVLGILAYRGEWLRSLPTSVGVVWGSVGMVAATLIVALRSLAPARWSALIALGGFNGPALVYSMWEAALCVGMSLGLIVAFRGMVQRPTRLLMAMASSSYAAYILHLTFVIGLQVGIVGLDLPPSVKFGFVTVLVRAESRSRENAVRLALGSGRGRLIQQVMTESVLLALLGGAGGVMLAFVATRALVAVAPPSIPRLAEIGISPTAMAFTTAISLSAGLIFGLIPAIRSGSSGSMAVLRDGGRGSTVGKERHRVRSTLVVAQVALALILVVGSGLMVRSFQALRSVDPGFEAGGVLTFGLRPMPTKYEGAEGVVQFYDQLRERLGAMPGVTQVGAITALPLFGEGPFLTRRIEEFPPAEGEFPPAFHIRRATPGYFAAMGIPVVEGRAFTLDDHNLRLGSIVISNSLKERYWPNVSAVGKRISGSTVVGVVGDVHGGGLDEEVQQVIYNAMLDSVGGGVSAMTLVLATAVDPLGIVPDVRRAIGELDADLPITDVMSMDEVVGDSLSRTSFTMSLLVLAALVALFLGSVGIYGVISYIVSQRTSEIGVRLALGATPVDVRGLVLRQGMKLALAGVAVGVGGALAMNRVLGSLLFEVSPSDPVAIGGGAVIFLSVAALASIVPARRAAQTPPAEALRGD